MIVSLIAAVAENGVIGKNNDLIWRISEDLKRFKRLTTGHHIILGRKNFESFPKPLPNRTHVILTRDKSYTAEGCVVVHSLDEALAYCKNEAEIFIIGGAEIYKLALEANIVDKLFITHVLANFEGDTFMPEINYTTWQRVYTSGELSDEKSGLRYVYSDYIKA
jgi:dihydrofolate reductase